MGLSVLSVAISLPLWSSVLLSTSHSLTANMIPNPKKYNLDDNTTILTVYFDNVVSFEFWTTSCFVLTAHSKPLRQ